METRINPLSQIQKQLLCQRILVIHDLWFIYFQKKKPEVAVTGNRHIKVGLSSVIEETVPALAILSGIVCHQLEIHWRGQFSFL